MPVLAAIASPISPICVEACRDAPVRVPHERGKSVRLCGELGRRAAGGYHFLLSIGLDQFSICYYRTIPTIKRMIHKLSQGECKDLAQHVFPLATSQEVQVCLRGVIEIFFVTITQESRGTTQTTAQRSWTKNPLERLNSFTSHYKSACQEISL